MAAVFRFGSLWPGRSLGRPVGEGSSFSRFGGGRFGGKVQRLMVFKRIGVAAEVSFYIMLFFWQPEVTNRNINSCVFRQEQES